MNAPARKLDDEWILTAPRTVQEKAGKIRMFVSGHYVNPLDVDPALIDIRDIAHHLSHICRFTGGTPFHYSVAQHSLLVSDYFINPELRLAGLLHDAPEAYLNDLASPVKHSDQFAFYRRLDDELGLRIFDRFNVDRALMAKTKPFDDLMFERESATFFGSLMGANRITQMQPGEVKAAFLRRFYELRPQLAVEENDDGV